MASLGKEIVFMYFTYPSPKMQCLKLQTIWNFNSISYSDGYYTHLPANSHKILLMILALDQVRTKGFFILSNFFIFISCIIFGSSHRGPVSQAGSLFCSFVPVTHFTPHKHLSDPSTCQQRTQCHLHSLSFKKRVLNRYCVHSREGVTSLEQYHMVYQQVKLHALIITFIIPQH